MRVPLGLVWRMHDWQHSSLPAPRIATSNEDQTEQLSQVHPSDVQQLLAVREQCEKKVTYQIGGVNLLLTYVERIGLVEIVNRHCPRDGKMSDGTVIEARNPRGDTAGCFVATDAGSYGTFYVYGEDVSVNPPAAGMRDGEVIAFYVDGYSATQSTTHAPPVITVVWTKVGMPAARSCLRLRVVRSKVLWPTMSSWCTRSPCRLTLTCVPAARKTGSKASEITMTLVVSFVFAPRA